MGNPSNLPCICIKFDDPQIGWHLNDPCGKLGLQTIAFAMSFLWVDENWDITGHILTGGGPRTEKWNPCDMNHENHEMLIGE